MQVLAPLTGLSLARVSNRRLGHWTQNRGCPIDAGSNPVASTMKREEMTTIETSTEQRESTLRVALADVYRVFGTYEAPERLQDAVPYCIDEDVNQDMCSLPLRELKRRHFYEYNNESQHEEQEPNEIKYFLPRLLELMVNKEEIHHAPALYLRRLGRCDPNALSDKEREVLGDFAVAYFAWGLAQFPDQSWDVLRYANAFDMLILWDIAGIDISPLLAHWLEHSSAAPTLHYVEAVFSDYLETGREIDDPFAEDRPEYRRQLKAWLDDKAYQAVFLKRVESLMEEPCKQQWQSRSFDSGIEYRVHAVLEALQKESNS